MRTAVRFSQDLTRNITVLQGTAVPLSLKLRLWTTAQGSLFRTNFAGTCTWRRRSRRQNIGTSRWWMVGHGLDRKSNLCPKNVKPMSKVCPEKGHVQGLSHWCPSLVKVLSNLCQVHDLLDRDWTKKSTACLNSVHISLKSCQFLQ